MAVVELNSKPKHTIEAQNESRERLVGVRKLTAQNLMKSHTEIPSVLVVEECDVTGLDMSYMVGIVLHTMGRLAERHPVFNAHFDGEELITFERSDISLAVDTPRGLMVPVVRDCANKDVDELRSEVGSLAMRARAGKITLNDIRGATATLTSPGKQGGVLATPLINPPQTSIIGIHRAVQRVVPMKGGIAVRTICNLTVTFDHRVADGVAAGAYTLALARGIEERARGYRAP